MSDRSNTSRTAITSPSEAGHRLAYATASAVEFAWIIPSLSIAAVAR
jgi:hypothetical protein